MAHIMPAFDRYPKEAELIGKILAGYGELEFSLCQCVSQVHNDFDMVLKTMYRARGEKQRIDIADAMGRSQFYILKLGDPFSEAIADIHECRKIRNRYAHCNWHDDLTGDLGFVDLEEIAKENRPAKLVDLTIRHLNVAILSQQTDYFSYLDRSLSCLNFEAQKRRGRIRTQPLPMPKTIPRPPAYK